VGALASGKTHVAHRRIRKIERVYRPYLTSLEADFTHYCSVTLILILKVCELTNIKQAASNAVE
jgi:hypothetical protein